MLVLAASVSMGLYSPAEVRKAQVEPRDHKHVASLCRRFMFGLYIVQNFLYTAGDMKV